MPLSAWTRRFGFSQGRLRPPAGFVPPEGLAAFGLGNDLPGNVESLQVGANIEVQNNGAFNSALLMRFKGKIRPPSSLPDPAGFKASMLVNGVERMSQQVRPGWTRTVNDWAANVSKLMGDGTISWKLEVTGDPAAIYPLELPAFYVDAITFEGATERPILANRIPEPGESQVPLDADIQLDIMDVGSSGVDLLNTQVFVRGVLAFNGGSFQPGFQGPNSTYLYPQADVLRVIIDPEVQNQFSSLEQVNITVHAVLTGGTGFLDQEYDFFAVDMTAPRLVSATAISQTVVRLSFDESVLQLDPLGAGDALNPAGYSFDRVTAPAASLRAVTVAPFSPSSVEITTQWEMTPGATYLVTASLLQDLFGNTILAPFNAVTFVGFSPQVPAGRSNFSLWKLMPREVRRRDDEGSGFWKLFLGCMQEVIDLFTYQIDRFIDFLDPDYSPEEWVDIMLQDLGNPFRFDLDLNGKRRLISVFRTAINESGSDPGLQNIIRFFLNLDVVVQPYDEIGMHLGESLLGEDWILGASSEFARYAFDIVSPRVLTDIERRRIRSLVTYYKAGWTHFVNLVEPSAPGSGVDHMELGLSELGVSWLLH